MHSLLARQIRRFFGSDSAVPQAIEPFVAAVNAAYGGFDQDRLMLERAMDLSSHEMSELAAGLRAIFHACPDLFLRLDSTGMVLGFNSAAANTFFASPDALVGKRIQDIPDTTTAQLFGNAIERLRNADTIITFEYSSSISEEERHYEVRVLRVMQDQLLAIIRDISSRKKLEYALVQSEKMSAVGQLAAGIAHEINNPLAVIAGFAEVMLQQISPGHPFETAVTSIDHEAKRCAALVKDLLSFSRNKKTEMLPSSLNAAVEGARTLIMARAKFRCIEVTFTLSPQLPPILGDEQKIERIVINLANNAIDAMSNEGSLTIATSTCFENNKFYACLKVADNGTGIPPEVLPRIFEPFFTTKPVGQGTGLGLSLVYEIATEHGAHIDVHSAPGCTEFLVKFPGY